MREAVIDGRAVGQGRPVFIIAEGGLNHNGNPETARRLIDVAADSGCDAVKFQKRCVRSMLTREAYDRPYTNGGNSFGATYGEHRERLELEADTYRELKAHAESRGLVFFASVWDPESADLMETLGVSCFKIGSPDLTNIPLCRHVAQKGLPILLSTGMSEMWEVEETVRAILPFPSPLVLMHCVSIYPAPPESLRLACIRTLQDRFDVPVGYSGHEEGNEAVLAAVALGACAIEKHITLDRSMKGGDHRFSLEPAELRSMVESIRTVEKAMSGSNKTLLEQEIPFRRKLGKSVVANRTVRKGEVITREMLTCKSPATGVSPAFYDRLVGLKAPVDLAQDRVIQGTDISPE